MKTSLAAVPAEEDVELSETSLEKDKTKSERTGTGTQADTDKMDGQNDKCVLCLNVQAEYLALRV